MKDAVTYIYGVFNYQNLMQVIDKWLHASNIPFRHISGNNDKFIIRHELGKNYTIYLNAVISSLLQELNYAVRNTELSDYSLKFEIIKLP